MKRALVLVTLLALVFPSISSAATPSPKQSPKPAAKHVVQPVAKSTHKPIAKRAITKKRKVYVRKKIPTLPSPSPKWPPANFSHEKDGTVYAKIPSFEELKGMASNSPALTADLKKCETNTCGAVIVAAETPCVWWEVDSVVSGPSSADPTIRTPYGSLRTLASATNAKSLKPILLISPEPLGDGVSVGGIVAKCWSQAGTERVPDNIYTPVASR
jgi:hypothetical protein